MTKFTAILTVFACLLFLPAGAKAQTPAAAPPVSGAQPAAAPLADQSQQPLLTSAQLEAVVAPIALYPDPLLSEVFMASTYPLEVIEAERWAKANKNLSGDALKAAVDQQKWDDSVKSLVATPAVLDMMSQQLDWTQQLGDAVLAQQADVMAAVQRLRAKAQASKTLASNAQQTVTTQPQDNGASAIVIQPTQPNTIYVPYYDPSVAYGGWPYPSYPPYYWPPPGYIAGGIIATGIAFGAGYAIGRWAGGYWHGGIGWGGNNITVNRNVNVNNINRGNNNWVHNPAHRQGVRYSNANVAQKFNGNRNVGGGAQNRMDFRGRAGDVGGNRPNAGNAARPNIGNTARSNAGNAARSNAGNAARSNAGNIGNRANLGNRGNVSRPSGGAIGNVGSGRAAGLEGARGRASMGGGAPRGGGFRAGGGARGGGGRRSDIRLKHDVVLLGYLNDGLGFYRFAYNGSDKAYVGVIAQEVQVVVPNAVRRGGDGYLRVFYKELGLPFQTYEQWVASGARLPVVAH